MLITNVNGEMVGASMVKDSKFYIEIAKFVQAYNTIIKNPNEFLREIHEPEINEKKEKLEWNKFVLIMQKCDLGFETKPTESELIVFYNYALEIGTLDSPTKKVATVSQVADAQKHYYNFIDDATDRANNEYLKQHRVAESRAREMKDADNRLMKLLIAKGLAFFVQMLGVFFATLGVVSLFFNNIIASSIGGIFKFWNPQYVGAIVLMIIGAILFLIFDRMFLNFKRKHIKLKNATEMIFKRTDETFAEEKFLKKKLDELKAQLAIVQAEISDKKHRFDVKYNIEKLKSTNPFYKKLCENEEEYVLAGEEKLQESQALNEEDFAPIKLSKEHSENLLSVSKEAINLEGQFDEKAYNEKFEKSRKKTEKQEDVQTLDEQKEQEAEELEDLENREQELMESIDYIKEILGFTSNEIIEEEEQSIEEEKKIQEVSKEK